MCASKSFFGSWGNENNLEKTVSNVDIFGYNTNMSTKQELRKSILEKRDLLAKKEHRQKSHLIIEKVLKTKEFQDADEVLLFASYKSEVQTIELIQNALKLGKSVYLPKVIDDEMEFYRISSMEDLKEGYKGIREPEAIPATKYVPRQNKKVFVLMPGAVFDIAGGRIGYGGGFYDRFLAKLEGKITKKNLCKVAVAFECQIVETGRIIREEHDIVPDYIVTEGGSYVRTD